MDEPFMSLFLYPVLINFIMKKTADEELSEIRLGLKTKLEKITFADDLALLSSRFKLA